MLGGIIAVARPRPGGLIVSLGLSLSGLVAGEFEPIARFMDWLEVRLTADCVRIDRRARLGA